MSADSVRDAAPGSPPAPAEAGSSRWYDAEAGPVVRPYAMTRGRTSSASRHRLDLIAIVVPEPAADDPGRDQTLSPEHVEIVELCSDMPQSIAELASDWTSPSGWSGSWWVTSSRTNWCTSPVPFRRPSCRT